MTTELEPQSIGVRLSDAEVVALAGLLGAQYVPGLGEDPLGSLTEEQVDAALGVAEAVLRARGYLAMGADGEAEVEETVAALLGACAFPVYSLVVETDSVSDSPIQHFFHHLDGLSVRHSIPEPGVHSFEVVSWPEIQAAIAEILEIEGQGSPTGEVVSVRQSILEGDLEPGTGFKETLLRAGVSQGNAVRLAEAFAESTGTGALVAFDHQVELDEPVRRISFVRTPTGFWTVSEVQSEDRLEIRPVSAEGLLEQSMRLAQPLRPAYGA